MKKIEVKLNKMLKALGVTYNEFTDEFIIRKNGIDEVIGKIDFDDFPYVKYDVNTGKLFIEISEIELFEEILSEIIEFIEKEKEKIEKANKKLQNFKI